MEESYSEKFYVILTDETYFVKHLDPLTKISENFFINAHRVTEEVHRFAITTSYTFANITKWNWVGNYLIISQPPL
jgi:hypothetical protein